MNQRFATLFYAWNTMSGHERIRTINQKKNQMKKLALKLSLALICSFLCMNLFAQFQSQGAGSPEGMGINVYIETEAPNCPTGGNVDGMVSYTTGGGGFPANSVAYTGPKYYYLFAPNANIVCGYGHAWAETEMVYLSPGGYWCEGYGVDPFNTWQGDYIQVYFDMEMEYDPHCEE